jgi:hypothetical protein
MQGESLFCCCFAVVFYNIAFVAVQCFFCVLCIVLNPNLAQSGIDISSNSQIFAENLLDEQPTNGKAVETVCVVVST